MEYQIIKNIINEHYKPRKENLFLDVGCGKCSLIFDLISDFDWITKLVGVDDDREGLLGVNYLKGIQEYSNEFKEISPWNNLNLNTLDKVIIEPMSIEGYLDEPKLKFDFVIVSNVLHYYKEREQRKKLLIKMKEVLKNEGMMFINIANTNHDYHTKKSEKAVGLSYETVISEVDKAGFQFRMNPDEVEEGHWYFIISQ